MALECMKRCSVEMYIKLLQYLEIIKKYDSTFAGKAVGTRYSHSAGGNTDTTFLEGNVVTTNNNTYVLTF